MNATTSDKLSTMLGASNDIECELALCAHVLGTYLSTSRNERDDDILHGLHILLLNMREQAGTLGRDIDRMDLDVSA